MYSSTDLVGLLGTVSLSDRVFGTRALDFLGFLMLALGASCGIIAGFGLFCEVVSMLVSWYCLYALYVVCALC